MDWLDLQRLATALIMPLSLGLLLGLIGLALVWRTRWLGVLVAGVGLGLIGVCSLPAVAAWLLSGLESDYPPQLATDCEPADAIVLLGGAIQPLLLQEAQPRLHRGSDRIWEAARLYHAGCAPLLVVSAGGQLEPPIAAPEAEAIAELLSALGVPRTALRQEAHSRNTQGNAAFTRALLGPAARWRVLLVTSAWHLRRAVALFEQAGFAVQPVGADDRSFPSCRGLPCWVPSAAALEASGLALKEVPGDAVQVRRGWGGAAGAAAGEARCDGDRVRDRARARFFLCVGGRSGAGEMKISVVTTLYNAVNTLSDCLDSVAAQTHTPREHIVIDGGSVDASLALLRQRGDQLAVLVRMRLGGKSNRNLKEIVQTSWEDDQILRRHGRGGPPGTGSLVALSALVWKNLSKLPQFIRR